MDASTENKNKYAALGFTLGFHALLLLLFILVVFITPIPPFPIPPTIEVTLDAAGMNGMGANAGGSGNNSDDIKTSPPDVAPTPTPAAATAPNIVTDDKETAAHVESNPKSKTDPKEDAPTSEEEKASKQLLAALEKLKSKNKHDGEGEGDKHTGGSGNGTSTGVGNGNDKEEGNGPFHGQGGDGVDLKGRSLIKKPERLKDATEEGVVVVEIVVDENGKVTAAIPGKRGSTTTSSNLYAKARQAALTAKFNPSPEGKKEQHGFYTFVFTLE